MIAAAYRAQADALIIESEAKRGLADEYDDAQKRGEVGQRTGRPKVVPDENDFSPATAADIGLTRKEIFEAREIRVRAERKCGELLKEMPKAKGAAEKGWNNETVSDDATSFDEPKTLSELGITRDQSSQWQQLAEVPDDEFEQALADPEKPSASQIINRTNFTGNKDENTRCKVS